MNLKLLGTAIGAGLLLSFQASATPLLVTGFAYPNQPTTVHIDNLSPSSSANVYAGGFLTDAGGNTFTSWCVDIFQHTYFGQTIDNYSLIDGATALGVGRRDALGRLATSALASVTNAATSGAFQLAIWEIINETSGNAYSLAAGNFKATNGSNGSIGLAQSWLDNLGALNLYAVNVWQSATRQDLAVFERTSVPEPASLTLLAVGLVAVGAARFRKARLSR